MCPYFQGGAKKHPVPWPGGTGQNGALVYTFKKNSIIQFDLFISRPKEVVSLLLDDEELERKYNVQTSDKSGTTTPGNEESVDIEGLFT